MFPRLIAATFLASLTLTAQSWPTFFSAYEDGLAAQSRGDHALAIRAFSRAASLNPRPGKGVRTYGLNYLPSYFPYLRLAESSLATGDLEAAEASLRQSASFGTEPQAEREALSGKVHALKESRTQVAPPAQLLSSSEKAPEKVPQKPTSLPEPTGNPRNPDPVLPPVSATQAAPTPQLPRPNLSARPSPTLADQPGKPSAEAQPAPMPSGTPTTPPSAGPSPVAALIPTPPAGNRARWVWLTGGGLLLALGGASALRRKKRPAPAPSTLVLGRDAMTIPLPLPTAPDPASPLDPNLARAYGPYLPIEVLGQGGCATTYFGQHHLTGEEVAIKVPHRHLLQDGDFKARFHREASLGALLDHPRIVPILDPGPLEGDPWLAMPFIRGLTLDQYLTQKGPLGVPEAVSIACDIREAIGFAHSKGIVHRDLKPGNVMMTGAGAIVMDFGIARMLDGSMTVSTMFLGTPLYSAPECVVTPRVGPPADRYALGIMLFEFLAGKPPFNGESPFQILEAQRSQPLPDLPAHCEAVPPRLLRLIQRLCAKSPDERPEDGETSIILNDLRKEHPRVPPILPS